MKGPKRKSRPGDWLFRAFALICIIVSFYLITKTKPGRTPFFNQTSVSSVSAEESYVNQGNRSAPSVEESAVKTYTFRNNNLLTSHYEKHGIEMGFADKESYQAAASAVITNPSALHKIEAEDGDDVYYVESTNEFVVLSTDGYIRTYFKPDSGKKYFDKQ